MYIDAELHPEVAKGIKALELTKDGEWVTLTKLVAEDTNDRQDK